MGGIVRDITERKQLDAQILRSQRLESIGTLAGGIAHDLNNVLAPILIGVEYLKTLAISRLYLDNILNVQSSWVTQGLKTCQVGLKFGGNDVGSIMIEENVVSQAGARNHASEEDLRRIIRDAGFVPKQRDTLYRTYFLN